MWFAHDDDVWRTLTDEAAVPLAAIAMHISYPSLPTEIVKQEAAWSCGETSSSTKKGVWRLAEEVR